MKTSWAQSAGILVIVQLLAATAYGVRLGVSKTGGEYTTRVPVGNASGWTVYSTPVDLQPGEIVHAMAQYQAQNENGINVKLYQFLVVERARKIHRGSTVATILKGGKIMAPASPAGGVITPNMVGSPRTLAGFYEHTGSAERVWVSLVVYASASGNAAVDIMRGYGGIATITHPAGSARLVSSQSHLVRYLPIMKNHSLWTVFEAKLGAADGYTAATVAAQYQAEAKWADPGAYPRNAMLHQFLSAHPSCRRYTGEAEAGSDATRVVPARAAGDNIEFEQRETVRTASGITPVTAKTTGCVSLVAYGANMNAQTGDKIALPSPGYGGLSVLLSKADRVESAPGGELVTTIPIASPAKGWTLYAVKVTAAPGSILQVAMQMEASNEKKPHSPLPPSTVSLHHMLVLHRKRTVYRGTPISKMDRSQPVRPTYPFGGPITTKMHHMYRASQGAVAVPKDWTEGEVWVSLVVYSNTPGTSEVKVEQNYGGISVAVYPPSASPAIDLETNALPRDVELI